MNATSWVSGVFRFPTDLEMSYWTRSLTVRNCLAAAPSPGSYIPRDSVLGLVCHFHTPEGQFEGCLSECVRPFSHHLATTVAIYAPPLFDHSQCRKWQVSDDSLYLCERTMANPPLPSCHTYVCVCVWAWVCAMGLYWCPCGTNQSFQFVLSLEFNWKLKRVRKSFLNGTELVQPKLDQITLLVFRTFNKIIKQLIL